MTVIKKYPLLSRQGSSCWLATSRMQFLVKGNQPHKWFTVTVSKVSHHPLSHSMTKKTGRRGRCLPSAMAPLSLQGHWDKGNTA